MPGLSGIFSINKEEIEEGRAALRRMIAIQNHAPWVSADIIDREHLVYARITPNLFKVSKGDCCYEDETCVFYLDGELFNQQKLKELYNVEHVTGDARILLSIFSITGSWDFLRDVDGSFHAVVFNKNQNTLFLISDRFGLRPLFYATSGDRIYFSGEAKGIIATNGIEISINNQAVREFMLCGFMLDDHTWFKGVSLLNPATVLTFSSEGLSQDTYWSFDDLKHANPDVGEDEVIETASELLHKAIGSRIKGDQKYSLPLSGGLDSRAILCLLPEEIMPVTCYSFGFTGCDDILFASRAAAMKNCPQVQIPLETHEDWLEERIPFLWLTDARANLMHMQGSVLAKAMYGKADIFFDGFLGDKFSGVYMDPIDLKIRKDFLGTEGSLLPDFDGHNFIKRKWEDSGLSYERFVIYQRSRRFVQLGGEMMRVHVENRRPFLNIEYLEYMLSLPDRFREGRLTYRKILLNICRELFEKIPYQRTGMPITAKPWQNFTSLKFRGLLKRIARWSRFLPGLDKAIYSSEMVDYDILSRYPATKALIEHHLSAEPKYITDYVDKERIKRMLTKHYNHQRVRTDLILRMLSYEIYMKILFGDLDRPHFHL